MSGLVLPKPPRLTSLFDVQAVTVCNYRESHASGKRYAEGFPLIRVSRELTSNLGTVLDLFHVAHPTCNSWSAKVGSNLSLFEYLRVDLALFM
jgi:hypothetical protein